MSVSGQKQTSDCRPLMSALPPKADIGARPLDVLFVPDSDVGLLVSIIQISELFWSKRPTLDHFVRGLVRV
jgi:hypothetical protein